MALSFQPDVAVVEQQELTTAIPLSPVISSKQEDYELERKQHPISYSYIDTGSELFPEDHPFQLKEHRNKIRTIGFAFNKPWLPPKVLKLLNRLKKAPISEKDLVKLMELVAQRASDHFQLSDGKFVAITFQAQIVEASDTRIDLLKKIQGVKYREQIFVYRIGSKAFSGRL